jgi:hypothetical protein
MTEPDIGRKLYEATNTLAPIVKRSKRMVSQYNTNTSNMDSGEHYRQSEERGRGNSPID